MENDIMENDIPDFFTDKNILLNYKFSFDNFLDSDIDESYIINNLSVPGDKKKLCENYFKSILLGYNHIYISKILDNLGHNSNICLPLIHKWDSTVKISNLVIISHPDDAKRICKKHIKKAPIFKSLLHTSIISTTDNDDWIKQRYDMNSAFLPKYSLQKIFPISQNRADKCSLLLKHSSDNYSKPVNMSEFFLNETQAQLQLAMFGFDNKFQEKTNKKIRNAFSGIETDYIKEFAKDALEETLKSDGPISELFHESKDIEKNIGNIIIFSFAGHDTTGHTLTWLLYELCKHPKYKRELIEEIDAYWINNKEESYDTFNQLPFMTRCITETLRMWPALANGTYRELETDDTLIGHNGEKVEVPKGTYCQIINWTRHRNPDLWGEDVHIFNPHRDFKDTELWNNEGFAAYNVFSERYSPFTYGPRNCIGKNFSHMEMRLILLNIFKNYDFELDHKQKETINDPMYMGINTFTMGPANIYNNEELLGMYTLVIPRKNKL